MRLLSCLISCCLLTFFANEKASGMDAGYSISYPPLVLNVANLTVSVASYRFWRSPDLPWYSPRCAPVAWSPVTNCQIRSTCTLATSARPRDTPTVVVRVPGRYEWFGNRSVWVPGQYDTVPASSMAYDLPTRRFTPGHWRHSADGSRRFIHGTWSDAPPSTFVTDDTCDSCGGDDHETERAADAISDHSRPHRAESSSSRD